MAAQRTERIAQNESAFRALNERLEAHVHRGRPAEDYAGFLCECGNPDCDSTIRLDLETYESIRQDSQLFVTLPGHDVPDVEDVVRTDVTYIVVRKHEDVADVVEQTDPRTASD